MLSTCLKSEAMERFAHLKWIWQLSLLLCRRRRREREMQRVERLRAEKNILTAITSTENELKCLENQRKPEYALNCSINMRHISFIHCLHFPVLMMWKPCVALAHASLQIANNHREWSIAFFALYTMECVMHITCMLSCLCYQICAVVIRTAYTTSK